MSRPRSADNRISPEPAGTVDPENGVESTYYSDTEDCDDVASHRRDAHVVPIGLHNSAGRRSSPEPRGTVGSVPNSKQPAPVREPTFSMKIATLAFWMMFLTLGIVFVCLLQIYAPDVVGKSENRWAPYVVWVLPVGMFAAFLTIWAASWFGTYPTFCCIGTCGVYWCCVTGSCDDISCDCDCDCRCDEFCNLLGWLFCAPCIGFMNCMKCFCCCFWGDAPRVNVNIDCCDDCCCCGCC